MKSKIYISTEILILTLTVSLMLVTIPTTRSLSNQMSDIYTINEGHINDHIWLSDGSKIAYIQCPEGKTWGCELWVADKSPGSAQLLNPRRIYSGVEWDKLEDGQGDWILFMRSQEEGTPSEYYGVRELWKIRADGTDLTQVTFTYTNGIKYTENGYYINRGSVGYGRFIPGTNLIYFSAHNGNGWYKAYTCNDDGTDQWKLISGDYYSFVGGNPSPTGNKLVWGHATYWNAPNTLRVSNVDGTDSVIIKAFEKRTPPLILADGNTIIYTWRDGDIYAIDIDPPGSNDRTVIDDEYFNDWANYNPVDGQSLIMVSDRADDNLHFFKINIDGTGIVQLTDGPYNDELWQPQISPDGQYILYRRLPEDFDKGTTDPPYPCELVVKRIDVVLRPLDESSWKPRTSMPTPRVNLATVVVNEMIYAIGGYNGTHNLATVEEYNPKTDTWLPRASMPTARGWLAATVVDGHIYVVGGQDDEKKYLTTMEMYDPGTDTWESLSSMPTPRYGLATVTVGGRIYAIGGYNSEGYRLTTVEEYNPTTDTWRPRVSMSTPRYGLAATQMGGRIYALGGHNAIDGYLATVEEYDPITNRWRNRAPIPTARVSLAAVTVGGRIYALGGWEEQYPSAVEEYDPSTDTWEIRTPLPTARTGLAAVVVEGRIYTIGGYDGNTRLGTVEVYDPPSYDTDGDGFADDEELRYGRDPLVPETEIDTDGDGLPDLAEVTTYGTNPWVPDADEDTDDDGLLNVEEVDLYGTNPSITDTDSDGLSDGEEVVTYGTDPLVRDTDGDEFLDGTEVVQGTNPTDPEDHPGTTTNTVPTTIETPPSFIPGFGVVELMFALACLVVVIRRAKK